MKPDGLARHPRDIFWSCRSTTRSSRLAALLARGRSGQLPELKRVIAAYGERVVMEETLGAALAALVQDADLLLQPPAESPRHLRACPDVRHGTHSARALSTARRTSGHGLRWRGYLAGGCGDKSAS